MQWTKKNPKAMTYKTLHRKLTIKHHERFTDSDNSFGIFKLFLPLQEHRRSTPVFVGLMVLDR
jgi:hypothetical protein